MTDSLYSAPSNHLRRASFYGNCSHESESVTSYQLCTSARCTLSPILLSLAVKMDSLQRPTRPAGIFPIADLKAPIRTWKDWAEVPWPSISESQTKESKVEADLMKKSRPGRSSCDASRPCESLEAVRSRQQEEVKETSGRKRKSAVWKKKVNKNEFWSVRLFRII